MVNEINKPSATTEDAVLADRLAASNRQLEAMQEEHRQLMQEMDTLRQRATELTHLNTHNIETEQITTTARQMQRTSTVERSETVQQQQTVEQISRSVEATTEEENSDESVDYIRQKMEEIATLKAQYRRVQNMINTTNMIEQHLSETSEASVDNSTSTQASTPPSPSAVRVASPTVVQPLIAMPTIAPEELANAIQSGNEELLSTMLTMFTDFTTDLRGQADSLRAERERIRLLKEELLARRRQT